MHSEKYLEELQTLHSKKTFGNASVLPKGVQELITKNEINSILDFGCGKGMACSSVASDKLTVHSYDPVTSPIPLPDKVDLVYSSDVLEHIEPDQLDTVMDNLYSIADKYQYHLIACHPAKKGLRDGRNAHVIIEKPDWWKEIIEQKNKQFGWKIVSEDITERHATVKKGPPRHVIKYIVYLQKV